MIGDDIEVVVLGYKDGQVRLGVATPQNAKGTTVYRKEVYLRIQEEKKQNCEKLNNFDS